MNAIIESVLKKAMGLNISSISKITLENALARRMRELKIGTEYGYIALLQSSKLEMNELIDEVAVNETWFFRDIAPFSALSKFAKNKLTENQNIKLRILSIPCATGEEPFSIVMTLYEAGISEYQFSLDAVDISKRSLRSAQQAIFRKRSFRGTKEDFQIRYFKEVNEGYVLADRIKNKVNFIKGNLISKNLSLSHSEYDIIFCRNLLIYLNPQSLNKAISTLDTLLSDQGLLFIGHAEAGYFSESNFTSALYPKAFSLIKKNSTNNGRTQFSTSKKVSDLPIQAPPVTSQNPLPFESELLRVKNIIYKGDLDKSEQYCEQLFKTHGPSAELFYILGLTYKEKKDFKKAIQVLKKSIYLNPELIDSLDLLTDIYNHLSDTTNYKIFARRSKRVKERLASHKTNKLL